MAWGSRLERKRGREGVCRGESHFVYCIELAVPRPCVGIPAVFIGVKQIFPSCPPFFCLSVCLCVFLFQPPRHAGILVLEPA